jgi:hypothetical protein
MRRVAACLAVCWLGCQPAASPSAAVPPARCRYDLTLDESGLVQSSAGCESQGRVHFRPVKRSSAPSIRSLGGERGRSQPPSGSLTYAVDLADLARRKDGDFDSAVQSGASFLAPMSSVLALPEPLGTETEVLVKVRAAAGVDLSVGLARTSQAETYRLMAHEIPVATYFAFGELEQRSLTVGSSELELTRLDGELEQTTDELAAWVETSASAVASFYGRFPVPRASIFVLPRADRDRVVFGKVLPESEPAIVLLIGEHAPRDALYSDWILVHELFHLGFPSFFEEGKWLDEGLATYYEPIIRSRAGLYAETELWDELEGSMPQGLAAFTELGLERARDFRGVYWGGAIACLVADVEARKRRLDQGLEAGLRALRDAGGTASEVWSLKDAVARIDLALGEPHLGRVVEAHAARGRPFDLAGLFRALGVTRGADGAIALSDQAPLAAVRRAIVHGR